MCSCRKSAFSKYFTIGMEISYSIRIPPHIPIFQNELPNFTLIHWFYRHFSTDSKSFGSAESDQIYCIKSFPENATADISNIWGYLMQHYLHVCSFPSNEKNTNKKLDIHYTTLEKSSHISAKKTFLLTLPISHHVIRCYV